MTTVVGSREAQALEMAAPAAGEQPFEPYEPVTTIGVFLNRAAELGDRPCWGFHGEKEWEHWSWKRSAELVRRVAAGFIEAGVAPGDRVALLSPNRIEWMLCDYALQAAGAIPVPVYPSLTPQVSQYIAGNSGAVMAVVGGEALAAKLETNDTLRRVLRFDTDIAEWMATDLDPDSAVEIERRVRALTASSMFTIIYTSGTTGDPKGVVLTHANFVENAKGALQAFRFTVDDSMLVFLPLSHVYQRETSFVCTMAGAEQIIVGTLEHILEDIAETRPTIMCGMPRLFDIMYTRVHDQVRAKSRLERTLFAWAERSGRRAIRQGAALGWRGRMSHSLAERLVLRSVRRRISGGRLRFYVSGGAPLLQEVEEFFWSLGIRILQGWGLTETTSGAASNTEDFHRWGTIGKPLPGWEVRFADDGEILVRGPGVMAGYFHNETATAETFDGDWFKTGDIGTIDADGFITITDRKKDLIKTSGGKYVAPLPLETRLESDSYIRSVVLVGDQRPFVTALIVPNWENLARELDMTLDIPRLMTDERIRNAVRERLDALNKELASFETIKHFSLLADDFTELRDELTPTLKPKRRVIQQHYQGLIDAMYQAATEAYKQAASAAPGSSGGPSAGH